MLYKNIKKRLKGRFIETQLDKCAVCSKHLADVASLCQMCLYEVCPDCMHNGVMCKRCFISIKEGNNA